METLQLDQNQSRCSTINNRKYRADTLIKAIPAMQPSPSIHGTSSHGIPVLHDHEFELLRNLIYRIAGISMTAIKKPLIASRLMSRIRHYNLSSYGDYYRMITAQQGKAELQIAVDLLTTNETHFFREPRHFDFFCRHILPSRRRGRTLRVWSAACSSGEEPYTLAMLLDDKLAGEPWELVASDLSSRVLEQARRGIYSAGRIPEIPRQYLHRYCLQGVRSKHGVLKIEKKLRNRVSFMQHNLTAPPPTLGKFDVIFLRNVLIYFDTETKRKVVNRLLPMLNDGGHFLISHSETLSDLDIDLDSVAPSIYRKPGTVHP